jgi:large subunit ribosomal protein L23
MTHTSLIKKFWITERAVIMHDGGKYTFEVSHDATKSEVKKAVKELYHVDAVAVNMIVRKGKMKRFRNTMKQRPGQKIAIVSLKEGQKIDAGH